MLTENKQKGSVVIKGRREMALEGVREVVDFDEENLHVKSVDGEIFIEGTEIKIGILDTEQGVVTLTGNINSFYYNDESRNEKKGFLKKLMR